MKRLGAGLAGSLAMIMALGMGMAYAAILFKADITGSATVAAKTDLAWYGVGTITPDGSGIKCVATVSGGKLNLTITDAYPGSKCTMIGDIAQVSGDLVLQDLTMSGLDVETLEYSSVSGHLRCGVPLRNTSKSTVRMQVTVPTDATIGTKPITGALSAVPAAQYDPALCNA